MPSPFLKRLEENLAPIYGKGMAPFVLRRALRRIAKDEETVGLDELKTILGDLERDSLARIYGANAGLLAAEITKHVHRGSVVDVDTVRRLQRADAVGRARELI